MILYYAGIALQIFCLYHAYTNRKEIYWYAVIFFLPGIGSIIYFLVHFLNKRDVEVVGEEINAVFNPTKKIKDLHKKLEFSDTFANRVELADAYYDKKAYEQAIEFYESALDGAHKHDAYVLEKLTACYYYQQQFDNAIKTGVKAVAANDLKNSKTAYYIGLSYKQLGQNDNAEKYLKSLDIRYSNYEERLSLIEYYIETQQTVNAKELIEELQNEFNFMKKENQRKYRHVIYEVNKLSSSIKD